MKIKEDCLALTITSGKYPGGIQLKDVPKADLPEIAEAMPWVIEVVAEKEKVK